MGDLVQFTKSGNVGVITINNPPVNALSPGVPEGISDAIDQLQKDDGLKAAVLIGGGSTFIAGADIKELEKMAAGKPRGAGLLPLLLKIEDCRKPVVAAIHGTALGGGMETAMASKREGWSARSEARHHPWRCGDTTAAAARGRGQGGRDVQRRQSRRR